VKPSAEDEGGASAAHGDVALRRYLDDLGRPPLLEDPAPRKLLKRLVPPSARLPLLCAATDALHPLQVRRARRLARDRRPAHVQLGSGRTPKPGWINVDLLGKGADIAWDLRRGLPFDDDSIDGVFHEHLLEHFSVADGYALTREIFRVLRSGGILRVAVPDAERYVRGYVTDPETLEHLRPGRPTRLLAVQEIFFRSGHRAAYDFETLSIVLEAAGFGRVDRRDFGDSEFSQPPDSEHRREESIFVEAVKP
jgi:predicted SAM-dependent methyltransferase